MEKTEECVRFSLVNFNKRFKQIVRSEILPLKYRLPVPNIMNPNHQRQQPMVNISNKVSVLDAVYDPKYSCIYFALGVSNLDGIRYYIITDVANSRALVKEDNTFSLKVKKEKTWHNFGEIVNSNSAIFTPLSVN